MPGHRAIVSWEKAAGKLEQAMVEMGIDPKVAERYAANLCIQYEDMRLEHLLTPEGEMPTGPQYDDAREGAIALAEASTPITEEQFVELGRRYAAIAKEILGNQSSRINP